MNTINLFKRKDGLYFLIQNGEVTGHGHADVTALINDYEDILGVNISVTIESHRLCRDCHHFVVIRTSEDLSVIGNCNWKSSFIPDWAKNVVENSDKNRIWKDNIASECPAFTAK